MTREHEVYEGIPYYHYEDGEIVQTVRQDRLMKHQPQIRDYGRKFRVVGNDRDSLPVRVFELVALDDPTYHRSCYSHKIELVNTLESEAMEL